MDKQMNITINVSAIAALYHYVFLVGKNMRITWTSDSVKKILRRDPSGIMIGEFIEIPQLSIISSEGGLPQNCLHMDRTNIRTPDGLLPVRARCLCSGSDGICGIAAYLDISTFEQLTRFNIGIEDFPDNDPFLYMLLMRSEFETSKDDLGNAIEELKHKHAELQSAEFYRAELDSKLKELKEQRTAMLNMLEDMEAARQEVHKLNENLEERVREEVNHRQKKEQMLIHQSRLAAMGEIIGAIAHQWRQPLNATALIIQDIKDAYEFGELDRKYIDDSVREAMQQINFMSKTIDDFRNFFRPDKEKKRFDVKTAIADVLSMLSAQLETNNISYRLTCHERNATFTNFKEITPCCEQIIESYENEMKQVFLNLINNSKDAIIEARKTGILKNKDIGLIAFDLDREGNKFIILVSDNAGGIPEEIIDKIFDPYFTTKEQGKGTGIGLYMSRVIIESNMGGRLTVRNINGGAEFRIEV